MNKFFCAVFVVVSAVATAQTTWMAIDPFPAKGADPYPRDIRQVENALNVRRADAAVYVPALRRIFAHSVAGWSDFDANPSKGPDLFAEDAERTRQKLTSADVVYAICVADVRRIFGRTRTGEWIEIDPGPTLAPDPSPKSIAPTLAALNERHVITAVYVPEIGRIVGQARSGGWIDIDPTGADDAGPLTQDILETRGQLTDLHIVDAVYVSDVRRIFGRTRAGKWTDVDPNPSKGSDAVSADVAKVCKELSERKVTTELYVPELRRIFALK